MSTEKKPESEFNLEAALEAELAKSSGTEVSGIKTPAQQAAAGLTRGIIPVQVTQRGHDATKVMSSFPMTDAPVNRSPSPIAPSSIAADMTPRPATPSPQAQAIRREAVATTQAERIRNTVAMTADVAIANTKNPLQAIEIMVEEANGRITKWSDAKDEASAKAVSHVESATMLSLGRTQQLDADIQHSRDEINRLRQQIEKLNANIQEMENLKVETIKAKDVTVSDINRKRDEHLAQFNRLIASEQARLNSLRTESSGLSAEERAQVEPPLRTRASDNGQSDFEENLRNGHKNY